MEERHIHAKNLKGYISQAIASRSGAGWVADFAENEKDEDGNPIQYRLTVQRGHERTFKTLNAAANTFKKMGFRHFVVSLK